MEVELCAIYACSHRVCSDRNLLILSLKAIKYTNGQIRRLYTHVHLNLPLHFLLKLRLAQKSLFQFLIRTN